MAIIHVDIKFHPGDDAYALIQRAAVRLTVEEVHISNTDMSFRRSDKRQQRLCAIDAQTKYRCRVANEEVATNQGLREFMHWMDEIDLFRTPEELASFVKEAVEE